MAAPEHTQLSSVGLPLLQHRQFLLTAPLPPSTTPILDRFHHGVHLVLLAYDSCPNIKWSTRGIEFLSDNGPEYTSHRFRPFVRAMGLIPCHTPRRSPESNGLAEAFFGSFKRDYVYQACLETVEDVARQLLGWIEHYNHQVPHSALGMRSPAECYAEWLVRNKTRPVQN